MKNVITRILLIMSVLSFGQLYSQIILDTTVKGRNAVLEEFTGINCVNCPDGHARANALYAAHPGRVVLINVHSGPYANPSAGQPDFRTPYGDPLDDFAGVAAYPSGTMNRIVWPGAYNQPPYYPQNPPGQLAIRRPGWWEPAYPGQGAGEYIILNGGNSPVNIGCVTSWNNANRELSVTVQLYYTASDSVAVNKLNVVFTQNGVVGYQSGGGSNYNHRHILREMITGLWGDTINNTTQGTLITRNYLYSVPADYLIDSCEISVFVTRDGNKHTHTGVVLPAMNGSTVGMKDIHQPEISLALYPNPVSSGSQLGIILARSAEVSVELFDVTGQLISTYKAGYFGPEYREISLMDILGGQKPCTGMYFLNVRAGTHSKLIKFIKE